MSLSKFTYIKELYRFMPENYIPGEDTDLSLDDVLENGAELRFYNEDENDLDIEPIKTLLNSLLGITTHKPQTDFDISSKIHHLFNEAGMNRIIAANGDVWDFLTVFYFNDYLCWRWKESPNKERFLSSKTKRNAISRLWWWAEITHDPNRDDPYELTKSKELLQESIQYTLDTRLPNNKDIMSVLLQYIIDKTLNDEQIKKFFVRAKVLNATRKCAIMDEETLNQSLDELMN